MGFGFDRAGVRIPSLAVSAYVDPQTVVTAPYRNTSLIATLRARWDLGPPLTDRDAAAPDIAPVLTRATPRPPEDWPEVTPRPVPQQAGPAVPPDKPVARLGQHLLGAAIALDAFRNEHVAGLDPKTATSQEAIDYLNDRSAALFPGLAHRPT
jgi:phospholipase C